MQLHFSLGVALLIFAGSLLAGIVGALVGLGGGIMVVPMLTIVFGFPIPFAIGVSIISVIATSSGAAVAYVRDRLTNIRIGMFLEIGTTLGAISGAFLAGLLAPNLLGVIFGFILLVSAAPLIFKIGEELPRGVINDRWARTLKLASSYPDRKLGREVSYQVTRTPFGLGMMYIAGLISGLLGIGSGTFKVIAMDTIMRLPLKVSTTTSNLMIGVTAAASAGIYFSRGNIPPLIAAPVALGVLMGALVGARLLLRMSNKILRIIFVPVILIAALEMILHGLGIGSF
ncbi:sulfite exporter TauE/SafE family protein [Dictyobacter halimunensis]